MHCINVSYKVPADKVAEVEEALKAHAEHMKTSYRFIKASAPIRIRVSPCIYKAVTINICCNTRPCNS